MTATIQRLREKHRERGIVRRLAAKLTGALWQLAGYEDADGNQETFDRVEVFHNVGFGARPRAGFGEAIVVNVGGASNHPVVICSRDHSITVSIEEDETVIYNSTGACVRITKTGNVLIGGMAAAHPAARGDSLQASLNAAIAALNDHFLTHPGSGVSVHTPVAFSGAGDLSSNVKVT